MSKPDGQLFVVAAPSGAGKTSLVKALVTAANNVTVAVSHTTRERRPEEVDGMNYHFVTDADFVELEQRGGFLECAQVFGRRYGTSRQAVEPVLATGQHLVLEIDWQGAQQIRVSMPDSRSIFILPPSIHTLRERLEKRGQDAEETIKRRMAAAMSEMSHYNEFDFVIVNDNFDVALNELRMIIEGNAQALALCHQRDALADLLDNLLPN